MSTVRVKYDEFGPYKYFTNGEAFAMTCEHGCTGFSVADGRSVAFCLECRKRAEDKAKAASLVKAGDKAPDDIAQPLHAHESSTAARRHALIMQIHKLKDQRLLAERKASGALEPWPLHNELVQRLERELEFLYNA